MVAALTPVPIDEVSFWNLPGVRGTLLEQLPTDLRDGMLFWQLLDAIRQQSKIIPLGPPYNIEYTVTRDPEVIFTVNLRHPCAECEDSLRTAQVWMRDNPGELLCFVQCTQLYLRDLRDVSPYRAT